MRVARRQHRTIREQSVQSSALKARLQQKAVARPSARVVNSKFTRLLSVFIRYIVFIPTPMSESPGLSLQRHRSRSPARGAGFLVSLG